MNYIKKNLKITKLKNFFLNNYIITIILCLIFVIFIIVWNFLGSYNDKLLYDIVKKYELVNAELAINTDNYVRESKKFIDENNNIYGVITALEFVSFAIKNGDLNNAQKVLTNALKKNKDSNIKDLINLRLARIKLEQGDLDSVIDIIHNIKNKSWQSITQMIVGDVFIYRDDKINAKKAYNLGLKSDGPKFIKNILTLKLNNIS